MKTTPMAPPGGYFHLFLALLAPETPIFICKQPPWMQWQLFSSVRDRLGRRG